jgi:1,4-dihydroxy-2-naphthoate octaprenyltransferase
MLDKMLSAMKDYHLPICVFMFLVGTVLSWFHHLDASFVAYTATILSAITGHAFSPAQKDHDNDTPSSSTPAGGS